MKKEKKFRTPFIETKFDFTNVVGHQMDSHTIPTNLVTPLTEEELDAITVVFHQYETGLREGTIYTKVGEKILEEATNLP